MGWWACKLDVVLRRGKDDAAGGSGYVALDQKQQRGVFFVVPAPYKRHLQLVADLVLGIKSDDLRVLQTGSGELGDCGGHSGREEQGLAAGVSHLFEDVADL